MSPLPVAPSPPQRQRPETSAAEARTPHSTDQSNGNAAALTPTGGVAAAMGTTTPLSSSRASRLSAVVGDGSFEQLMKERARIRKEKDEHSVAELRVQLASMDRALSQEIKRRIDLNRSLEQQCAERVSDMEARLTKMVDERSGLIQNKLEELEKKVEELNARFEEEKEKIPRDIERRGKELGDLLGKLQEELGTERRDRLSREGRIMKQISDHGEYVSSCIENEKRERESIVAELRSKIDAVESSRADANDRYSERINTELRLLREALETEVAERKMEDDEVVEALNRYTEHLQTSLSVMND